MNKKLYNVETYAERLAFVRGTNESGEHISLRGIYATDLI